MIDDEDEEIVSRYNWCMKGCPHTNIRRYQNGILVGRRLITLHQFLLGDAPEGLEWDHIDRNPLNNQRFNLRLVEHFINQRNRDITPRNISGAKGVYPAGKRWIALIHGTPGHELYLGHFDLLEDAIKIRKEAELKYWGENPR